MFVMLEKKTIWLTDITSTTTETTVTQETTVSSTTHLTTTTVTTPTSDESTGGVHFRRTTVDSHCSDDQSLESEIYNKRFGWFYNILGLYYKVVWFYNILCLYYKVVWFYNSLCLYYKVVCFYIHGMCKERFGVK